MEPKPRSISSFWKRETNILSTNKEKWIFVLIIVVFVPFFLIVFQPFGVNNYDPTHTVSWTFLLASISFGIVNALTIAFFEFLVAPFLFKKTTRLVFMVRVLLELILLATITFLLYNVLGNFHDFSLKSYFGFIRDVSLMAVFPLTIVLLFLDYKRVTYVVEVLMEESNTVVKTEKFVRFKSKNGREEVSITLVNLLFIEAQDNYISIHHMVENNIKKQLLRTTMKDVENHLNLKEMVRCHRSFIVNMNKVNKVVRDGHQMKLFLSGIDIIIPVSRSYISIIENILDVHHK